MQRTRARTNAVLCREYLDWQRDTRHRTGVTVYNYTSTLTAFLDHVGTVPLAEVSMTMLEAFVRRPRWGRAQGEPGAPATQAKDVAILRSLYAYLVGRGHVQKNPCVLLGAPKVANKNPRPIPDDDWRTLWSCAADGVERMALGLGFYVGLRRREICELAPRHVHVAGGRLVGFKRKGGGDDVTPYADCCEALAPLGLGAPEFPEQLALYVKERVEAPFLIEYGEHVPTTARERAIHELPEGATDPNLLNKRMAAVCERAHVAPYTPHQLRHSFVTNLLRVGVPLHLVSSLANHSSPDVTMRYAKAGGAELREWMSRVNRHAE